MNKKEGFIALSDVATEEMQEKIETALKDVLLRLGINVEIYLTQEKIWDGRLLVKIRSTAFNTTPVIYKAIEVRGDGFIRPYKDTEDRYELYLSLSYRFTYFNGSENGVDIGVAHFLFKEQDFMMFDGLKLMDR